MPLPSVPTLSLADNGNDTGFTATISGATAGTTNTLYFAAWSLGFIGAAFASGGSRVSDGTIPVTAEAGYYWAYVKSTNASGDTLSLVGGVRVTTGSDALYQQILDAVANVIAGLDLSIDGDEVLDVYNRKLPWNQANIEKGIHVSPTREQIIRTWNSANDIGHGVQVTICWPSNQKLIDNKGIGLGEELLVRETLLRAFEPTPAQVPLTGVSEVYQAEVEPGPVIDPGSFINQFDVQALLLRFWCRVPRGL